MGGKIFTDAARINLKNIDNTSKTVIDILKNKFQLTDADFAFIGSTGKKETSGDIDIGINVNSFGSDLDLRDKCLKIKDVFDKEDFQTHFIKGLEIVSIRCPIQNIDGFQENLFVQIDLMVFNNLKFGKWRYYSPHESESLFSGLYRNALITAMCATIRLGDLAYAIDESDGIIKLASWSRFIFTNASGLATATKTFIPNGKFVKKFKNVDKKIVSDDPDEIVEMLFGKFVRSRDILTFEDAFNAVNDPRFIWAEIKNQILYITSRIIIDEKKKTLPTCLNEFADVKFDFSSY